MSATRDLLPVAPGVPLHVLRDERGQTHQVEEVPLPGFSVQAVLQHFQHHCPEALARVLIISPTLKTAEDAAAQGAAQFTRRLAYIVCLLLPLAARCFRLNMSVATFLRPQLLASQYRCFVGDRPRQGCGWPGPSSFKLDAPLHISEQRKGRTDRTNQGYYVSTAMGVGGDVLTYPTVGLALEDAFYCL